MPLAASLTRTNLRDIKTTQLLVELSTWNFSESVGQNHVDVACAKHVTHTGVHGRIYVHAGLLLQTYERHRIKCAGTMPLQMTVICGVPLALSSACWSQIGAQPTKLHACRLSMLVSVRERTENTNV